ncbi:sulfite exporter TauE/SafE family protein, partial [Pseudidiomarina halophila]|uniref:sulfite exporter TauE/SafE family protein n=1 Tax=Pseudidiomarina halophila TaxID=1449799 RepID=UPI00361FD744
LERQGMNVLLDDDAPDTSEHQAKDKAETHPQISKRKMNLDVAAAFLMGLAGAGHCLMMCGGLAGALGAKPALSELIIYNLGRITSYMFAGVVVGLFSQLLLSSFAPALIGLRFVAAFFLIALGCYFGGWWLGLQKLERIGRPLWRTLAPYATRLRNNNSLSAVLLRACSGAGYHVA